MPSPDPGSTWIDEVGLSHQVTALTRRGILLTAEDGTQRWVAPWDWPGQWTPSVAAMGTGRPILRALLVGGEASGVQFERLKDQAADLDVDVEYHVPWSETGNFHVLRHLPNDVELVILVASLMSHGQYYAYRDLAKKEGSPFVVVNHRGFRESLRQELRAALAAGKLQGLRSEGYGRVPESDQEGWWELSPQGHWVRRNSQGGMWATVLAALWPLLMLL